MSTVKLTNLEQCTSYSCQSIQNIIGLLDLFTSRSGPGGAKLYP